MLTVGILFNEAYGVSVKKDIETRLSRNVSMGALHTALTRLEDKGYLKTFDGRSHGRTGRPAAKILPDHSPWQKGNGVLAEHARRIVACDPETGAPGKIV